ncbi:hypothetical protein RVD_158 [viral metagenome]
MRLVGAITIASYAGYKAATASGIRAASHHQTAHINSKMSYETLSMLIGTENAERVEGLAKAEKTNVEKDCRGYDISFLEAEDADIACTYLTERDGVERPHLDELIAIKAREKGIDPKEVKQITPPPWDYERARACEKREDYCTPECEEFEPEDLWDTPCPGTKDGGRHLTGTKKHYHVDWIDQTNTHVHHVRAGAWEADIHNTHDPFIRCDGYGSSASQTRAMVRDKSYNVPGPYHGGIGGFISAKPGQSSVRVHIHDVSAGGMYIHNAHLTALPCDELPCTVHEVGNDLLITAIAGNICGIFVVLDLAVTGSGADFFSQPCASGNNVCTDRDCGKLPQICNGACCGQHGSPCQLTALGTKAPNGSGCYHHFSGWNNCIVGGPC